ncbi:MAG: fibronectin type III domain-containing protein [Candidatus Omnitrophota bacterium]
MSRIMTPAKIFFLLCSLILFLSFNSPAQGGTISATPQNVRCTSTTLTSVSLAWDLDTSSSPVPTYIQVAKNTSPSIDLSTQNNWITTTGPVTSYTWTGLNPNTTYYFWARAFCNAGCSGFSITPVVVTTGNGGAVSLPAVPVNLSATPATAAPSSSIVFTFSAGSANTTGFKVFRWDNGWIQKGTVANPANSTSPVNYTDSSLTASTTYYYTVSAVNAAGESSQASYVYTTTQTGVTVSLPAVPVNLSATPATAAPSSSIVFTFSAGSANTTGFKVFRWDNGWIQKGTVANPANSTSPVNYTDSSLTASTTYYYTVSAVNAAGESSQASYVYTTTQAVALVDTTPPTGTIIINKGIAITTARRVRLTLAVTDTGSGMGTGAMMRLGNSSAELNVAAWVPYATAKVWTLSAGTGSKTVYAQFKDAAGNASTASITATITLNNPPRSSIAGKNINGEWWVAQSVGTSISTARYATGVDQDLTHWRATLTADVDGDGLADLVGYKTDGTLSVWRSGGTYFTSETWGSTASGVILRDLQASDVNNDGRTDIIGRTDTGDLYIARSTGAGFAIERWGNWTSSVMYDVQAGDVNGDGMGDLIGRTAAGDIYVARSTGTSFTIEKWGTWGVTLYDVQAADVNGDGMMDLVGRTLSGDIYVALSTGTGFTVSKWGTWSGVVTSSWNYLCAADVDGDGMADIAGLTIAGDWYVARSTGTSFVVAKWGGWSAINWYDVQVADVDGDGLSDMIGRNDAGEWWAAVSNGTQLLSRFLGSWNATCWLNVQAANFTETAYNALSVFSKKPCIVDDSAPSGYVSINNGAATTTTTAVTLTIGTCDTGLGVARMRIANDIASLPTVAWEACIATKAWTLTSGAGTKTVYVQLQDCAGNISAALVSNSIVLSDPSGVPNAPSNVVAATAPSRSIKLTWTNKNAGNVSRNEVWRKKSGDASYAALADVIDASASTFTDKAPIPSQLYYYKMRVLGSNGTWSAFTAEVSAISGALSVPNAPTNLSLSGITASTMILTWSWGQEPGAYITIKRKEGPAASGGSAYATVKTISYTDSPNNSWTDTGLCSNCTYTYSMCAGDGSLLSALVTVTGSTSVNASVQAPSGLVAALGSSPTIQSMAVLTWTNNASSATYVQVERSADNNGNYQLYNFAASPTSPFNDTNVELNKTYYYRIKAFIPGVGYSACSNECAVTTLAAPDSLSTTAIGSKSISIAWRNNTTATSQTDAIKVERYKTDLYGNGPGTPDATFTLVPTDTSFTDTSLVSCSVYGYKVSAHNTYGYSRYVYAGNMKTRPETPQNLTIQSVGSKQVTLTWNWTYPAGATTQFISSVDRVKIQRKSGSIWSDIGLVPLTQTMYTDTLVSSATAYLYRACVYVANAGISDPTSEVSATTAPSAPTNLIYTVTLVGAARQVNLTWADQNPAGWIDGFVLERSNAGTDVWAQIATPVASARSYNDQPGTGSYCYRLRACKGALRSDPSNIAVAIVYEIPPVPTNLALVSKTHNTVTLKWSYPAGEANTTLILERKAGTAGTYAAVRTGIVSATAIAFIDNDGALRGSTQYFYRMRAYNAALAKYSSYSNEIAAVTSVTPPYNVTLGKNGNTISLTWQWNNTVPAERIWGFSIERQSSCSGVFTSWKEIRVTQYPKDGLSYTDRNLSPGVYEYRIRTLYNGPGGTDPQTEYYSVYVVSDPAYMYLYTPIPVINAIAMNSTSVTISWSAKDTGTGLISNDYDGMYLYRQDKYIGYFLRTAGQTYIDASCSPGCTYTYSAYAYSTTLGASNISNSATVQTYKLPTPTIAITASTSTSITLGWTPPASAADTYDTIQIFKNSNLLTTVSGSSASFTNTGLTRGSTYSYFIRGVKTIGGVSYYSNYSATVSKYIS